MGCGKILFLITAVSFGLLWWNDEIIKEKEKDQSSEIYREKWIYNDEISEQQTKRTMLVKQLKTAQTEVQESINKVAKYNSGIADNNKLIEEIKQLETDLFNSKRIALSQKKIITNLTEDRNVSSEHVLASKNWKLYVDKEFSQIEDLLERSKTNSIKDFYKLLDKSLSFLEGPDLPNSLIKYIDSNEISVNNKLSVLRKLKKSVPKVVKLGYPEDLLGEFYGNPEGIIASGELTSYQYKYGYYTAFVSGYKGKVTRFDVKPNSKLFISDALKYFEFIKSEALEIHNETLHKDSVFEKELEKQSAELNEWIAICNNLDRKIQIGSPKIENYEKSNKNLRYLISKENERSNIQKKISNLEGEISKTIDKESLIGGKIKSLETDKEKFSHNPILMFLAKASGISLGIFVVLSFLNDVFSGSNASPAQRRHEQLIGMKAQQYNQGREIKEEIETLNEHFEDPGDFGGW